MTDYNLRQIVDSPVIESAYLWDFDNMNLKLTIDHGKFVVTDNVVLLCATASDGHGFKQKDNYKWKWEKGETHNVVLAFHQKARTEQDYKTKEKKTVEPHPIELMMAKIAAHYGDTDLKGNLHLMMSGAVGNIIHGKRDDGTPLPDEFISMMIDSHLKADFIEPPEGHPWTPDIIEKCMPKEKSGGSYKGGYGSKSQSEAERIADREKWFVGAVVGRFEPEGSIDTLKDAFAFLNSEGVTDDDYNEFMDVCKTILG